MSVASLVVPVFESAVHEFAVGAGLVLQGMVAHHRHPPRRLQPALESMAGLYRLELGWPSPLRHDRPWEEHQLTLRLSRQQQCALLLWHQPHERPSSAALSGFEVFFPTPGPQYAVAS